MGSINIIVTIFNLRAPGMTMMKLPLFAWGWLITAFLLIATIPVLAGAVTMLLTDRHFGTHFFNAAGGGDPILFQHLFWFLGHPEVYILLLPSGASLPHVLSNVSRKPTYGYQAQVYSFIAIGLLSVIVWAHHFFTAGLPVPALIYFMFDHGDFAAAGAPVLLLDRHHVTVASPSRRQCSSPSASSCCWDRRAHRADACRRRRRCPYHHSYFVVAHFHYALFAGGIMGVMTGVFTGCRSGPATCKETAWQAGISG